MVHCYACATTYAYLGSTPHPGECPECGSDAVSPAGDLEVVGRSRWESANGLSTVRVRATDARSRPFAFEVVARRTRGKLVDVAVEGVSVDPARVASDGSLPPAVEAELESCGISEVRPNRPLT